ncbi:MAG: ribonuclease III [Pseudomonadales bacterium]
MTDRALHRLQDALHYQFRDVTLLERAVTHRSVGVAHNERLEFLGDSVLGPVVSDRLYAENGAAPESDLTLMRARLVKRETLARVAQHVGIGEAVRLGVAASSSGVHRRGSVLADTLEAVLGAIYLDGGLEAVRAVIDALLQAEIQALKGEVLKDAKTRLQEVLQARGDSLPVYEVIATHGKDHARTYEVRCSALGRIATGTGRSRRAAEQAAAVQLLGLQDPGE